MPLSTVTELCSPPEVKSLNPGLEGVAADGCCQQPAATITPPGQYNEMVLWCSILYRIN